NMKCPAHEFWNGNLDAERPGREQYWRQFQPCFPQLQTRVWKLWSTRHLCRNGAFDRLYSCDWERTLHITHRLFTGTSRPPVEGVGKTGHLEGRGCRFSKTPELHSPDLENRHTDQTVRYKLLQPLFHFSCLNYGYY